MQSIKSDLETLESTRIDGGIRVGADTGKPHTWYSELFDRDDIEVGLWGCTPGGWQIDDRPDTEVVHVLRGRARITDHDGESYEVGAGDIFVMPAGWSGRWDILDDLKKLYVIINDGGGK
ncbi:MAG: DUF861 domain-containing protein [Acidimicrobiia bacterium]|nr:DUF861 domain-containing protein [Acidimicrobiia bacterium]